MSITDEFKIEKLSYAVDGEKIGENLNADEQIKNFEKLKIITFKVYEKRLGDIWTHFEEKKITPILIKGWAAAVYYSRPYNRRLGDFDLAINPSDYEKASILQKELQLSEVDLHDGLRRLDKTDWNNLFENSMLVECGKKTIRILRPEDHLRVLCVHWLIDGGRDKEKLRDIYYAVKNRPENFDWNRCLETICEKRRRWIIYTIGLAHKYFGLATDGLPFAVELKKIPEWLTETVENEWENPVEFKYLQSCLGSWDEFVKQLGRRFPPNPIQATINMEGDFDASTRFFYQIGDVFGRVLPSIRRVSSLLYRNSKKTPRSADR